MTQSLEILVVEDDPIDRRFISRALLQASSDLSVETAADGASALEWLSADNHPDLILFDLKMPRMDGVTFLGQLKSDGKLGKIPAIVLSTSDDPADISRCLEGHANAYLTKPDTPKGYSALAERLIDFWFCEARRAH